MNSEMRVYKGDLHTELLAICSAKQELLAMLNHQHIVRMYEGSQQH